MGERSDGELDLILSNLDAGLRLLGYLCEQATAQELPVLQPGAAYLIECLIADSAGARTAYERLSSLAAAQAGDHDAA